jgi:hypothetical protein
MEINSEKYYTLNEARRLASVSSREILAKYIENGHLLAIQMNGKGKNGNRYKILGEWIIDFNKRYDNGFFYNSSSSVKNNPLSKEK